MQTMVGSSDSSSSSSSGEAGPTLKRKADESNLSDDSRFTKRFNLLNLGAEPNGNSNFYIPVANSSLQPPPPSPSPPPPLQNHAAAADTSMQVDDTRDRVYIHDLDAELASDAEQTADEPLIFLPDIERYFSKLPQQMLQGRKDGDKGGGDDEDGGGSGEGKELVLYTIPSSVAVDRAHDSVRRAIIESRQRAREKAAAATSAARQHDMDCRYDQSDVQALAAETAHGYGAGYGGGAGVEEDGDGDAMDMD